ncbi:MAG: type I CRISPR-associated protein Cas7 [Planctomycetales bacterium]|nr:type I CRISPR-associated protein Cas7 [Planctomycetales bacterium]MCA9197159.1 type I CRISPR-associated protein Cas7 [Planctomycetales bacterium]
MNKPANSGEILFVKSVKDGIPNRDPLRDSDARRIFGEDDGRISLSDVSIKRDVRDYVLDRYPDGGSDKSNFVFVRKERTDGNKLLGREKLATTLLERAGRDKDDDVQTALMASAFDTRIFGAVFSVKKASFNQCGPVQFGWAHSLHPVETKYVQGTVVMPSKDIEVKEGGESEGATQGTIWTSYTLPFAVFVMPAIINASIAKATLMTSADRDLLLEGLWKGTLHRQARGRGMQQPLFLLDVQYKDDFYRIGYLEELVSILPERNVWLGSKPPASLSDVTLNVENLAKVLAEHKSQIATCRLWASSQLKIQGKLPDFVLQESWS